MSKALLIVDVQNDFCEGGALGVEGGSAVAEGIAAYLRDHEGDYDLIVASRDWHHPEGDNGGHFAAPGESPDFVNTWPAHCVMGTTGANYHDAIDTRAIDVHIIKGMGEAAYSPFDGISDDKQGATLEAVLRAAGIRAIDVVGLAKDYCVQAAARDASEAGFVTTVLDHLTAAVHPENSAQVDEMLVSRGTAVLPDPDAKWADLAFEQRLFRVRAEVGLPENMLLLVKRDNPSAGGRWYFQIEAERPDTFTGEMGVGRGGKAYLSPHATQSELVQCAFRLLLSYVEHEARESFTWRGRRVFGPHIDVQAHWDVARRIDARSQSTEEN